MRWPCRCSIRFSRLFPTHARRRRAQANRSPLAGLAAYLKRSANGLGALSHAGQSKVPLRGAGLFLRCSTTAVVTDFQCNRTGPVLQLDEKLPGPRMLLHIMDGLLGHAQQFLLGPRREWTIRAEDAELGFETGASGRLGEAPQLYRQAYSRSSPAYATPRSTAVLPPAPRAREARVRSSCAADSSFFPLRSNSPSTSNCAEMPT